MLIEPVNHLSIIQEYLQDVRGYASGDQWVINRYNPDKYQEEIVDQLRENVDDRIRHNFDIIARDYRPQSFLNYKDFCGFYCMPRNHPIQLKRDD